MHKRLNQLIEYNPETGDMVWRRDYINYKAGEPVAEMVVVDLHKLHRNEIAWLIYHKKQRKILVDKMMDAYFLKDPALGLVAHNIEKGFLVKTANGWIRKDRANYKGVYYNKRDGKWFGRVWDHKAGGYLYTPYLDTEEEARKAREIIKMTVLAEHPFSEES